MLVDLAGNLFFYQNMFQNAMKHFMLQYTSKIKVGIHGFNIMQEQTLFLHFYSDH